MAVVEAAGEKEQKVILVGLTNCKESFYALDWTLRHHFSGEAKPGAAASKLVVVYAKPTPSSVIGFGGLGAVDILPFVESSLSEIATSVIAEARELCVAKTTSEVVYEVIEGDASTVLCDAVEKFQADLLVLGSYGYPSIKRTVIRSVKDYCAHNARCNVMIVKQPMQEN
ncbi:Universal stress protein A-like protein [Dendrobium catenatum]|uniref:Universal stress protein A-like protein n=1 Tax=Dendrobium catenatum TaxID=906689 RepID=A0A2I0XFQ1_9ASPA|nr:Universal stress protein A-like protein [Dendrobium catenatum]